MNLGKAPEQGTIALILLTAVITGLVVNVFGKRVAEYLLDLLLWPVRVVYELVYRWVAPRNPFSISLRSYRRHLLRSNLARMENPVGPNLDVPLEYAFAPVKVRSNATQESVDLYAYVAQARRCMILGGPGTGKTTLMKSLVISIATSRCHENLNDLIPVFIVLRNLAKQQHSIQEAIVAALAEHHFPGADNYIESTLEAGKLLIVLDGLDEVGANREFVADQILSFCRFDDQRAHSNKLLVTCREHSYRTQDLREGIADVLQVEPFTNHHMRVFLEGWPTHRGRSAIGLYGLIQSDPQIRDICRNPLLLTILTGLYLDADNFRLPTSREVFYENAIDELLSRRPARRQIKQQFEADDKRQVLERVALDRLETMGRSDDPEELTQDALRNKVVEVTRNDKVDFHGFMRELVDINGIVKPTNEGSYSFAHRTILEFFAAREALRTREPFKVLVTFGQRPELTEVLYFYCGLQRNLPALSVILEKLIHELRWLEAGQALLSMKEPPTNLAVQQIAAALQDYTVREGRINDAIAILSSLASRQEPEFAPVQGIFASTIELLTLGDERGAGALESAIATSPEIAFRLIPSLLAHHSERWKAAGVQLLRDIGTDEALDNLVQLLKHEDLFVRGKAAGVLAGMIRTRNTALRRRAALLPARTDKTIWPLEKFFPGTIAIPIAEALAPHTADDSDAITQAVKALQARANGTRDPLSRKWQRVAIDAWLDRFRELSGQVFARVGYYAAWLFSFGAILVALFGYVHGKDLIISIFPSHLIAIDHEALTAVSDKARHITTDIETAFPARPYGWRRILPWNWIVEPDVPLGKIEGYRSLARIASGRDPINSPSDYITASGLGDLISTASLNTLGDAVKEFGKTIDGFRIGYYLIIRPSLFKLIWTVIMLVVLATLLILDAKSMWRSADVSGFRHSGGGQFMLIVAVFSVITFVSENPMMMYGTIAAIPGFALLGQMIRAVEWPKNPLLRTVAEVAGVA